MSRVLRPILAAEDEEADRLILKLAFERAKLAERLVIVSDGGACMDYLSGIGSFADRHCHPLPALLLLDLKMPRRDGFEVLEWLGTRPEFKDLPAVVISSSSADSDIAKARQLGARDYFVKPTSLNAWVEILQQLNKRFLASLVES